MVDAKYKLIAESGNYQANSLMKLLWEMLMHRFEHFRSGDGFID